MSEITRIVTLLSNTFSGDPWHGPSLRTVLTGVTAAQAVERPVGPGHSIWEIVLHIAAWEAEVCRRIEGRPARTLSRDEDFPAAGHGNEVAWEAALRALEDGHRRLCETVGRLSDARLDEPIGGDHDTTWSVYETLHGIIQHTLYHAGQIAILRRSFAD